MTSISTAVKILRAGLIKSLLHRFDANDEELTLIVDTVTGLLLLDTLATDFNAELAGLYSDAVEAVCAMCAVTAQQQSQVVDFLTEDTESKDAGESSAAALPAKMRRALEHVIRLQLMVSRRGPDTCKSRNPHR